MWKGSLANQNGFQLSLGSVGVGLTNAGAGPSPQSRNAWQLAIEDTVTWLKGSHTLKGGLLYIYNTKKQNGRSDYTGNLSFNPTGNPNSTGYAFADALLGNFRTYQEAQLDPLGYFRYWQFEGFLSDAWRVSDRLSVEAGIRYMWQMPTITLGNNTTSFDPALYNASQAVTLKTNGTIDTAASTIAPTRS